MTCSANRSETPMITRDFILRQIQQLVQVLARAIFLKSQNQPQHALEVINEALEATPELRSLLISGLLREDVLAPCLTESGFAPDKALALADLMCEKARLMQAQGEIDVHSYFEYALWLYEAAMQDKRAALPLDITIRLDELRAIVGGLLPP